MEQLPETREALAEFIALEGPDPQELLDRLDGATRRLVPSLVGLSLSLAKEQLTFTLVASQESVAVLDATQYLDGGPCVEVGQGREEALTFATDDPLDEERWRLFAQANAAHGVASTLSLPWYVDARLVGSVNLYASTSDAFVDRIEDLAFLVGALPDEAVRNADLSFSTRMDAALAPQRLHDHLAIETAIGLVAADKRIDLGRARAELIDAATQAGVRLAQVARVVVKVYTRRQA